MAYTYADKQTIIKADVSLTSTSEKHIVNLATIVWPLEQTPQQVNSDVTQVRYDPQTPVYLVQHGTR